MDIGRRTMFCNGIVGPRASEILVGQEVLATLDLVDVDSAAGTLAPQFPESLVLALRAVHREEDRAVKRGWEPVVAAALDVARKPDPAAVMEEVQYGRCQRFLVRGCDQSAQQPIELYSRSAHSDRNRG